jgi:4-hydroxythreonine-4-phosphate dehydrogenase
MCFPVVIGSLNALEQARKWAPQCPQPVEIPSPQSARDLKDGFVGIIEAGVPSITISPGTLSAEAGRAAVTWIRVGTQYVIDGDAAAIVTCPINKEGIHKAGCRFPGHTELIADMTGSCEYWMCLFTDSMRIVHITSHLSLRDAIDSVRTPRIADAIRAGHKALMRLALPRRRVAVAALNPHAGEAGAFGDEEGLEIVPAIELCQSEGIDCVGPFPPDTVFARMRDGEFDLVVSMYHDQGHIPLKLIAMDEGVNVTLGIPIIRTSVDHGTAYEIAGQGVAREHSLCAAIKLAAQMADTDVKHNDL